MLFQFIHKNKISHQNLLDEISKKIIRYYETIYSKEQIEELIQAYLDEFGFEKSIFYK